VQRPAHAIRKAFTLLEVLVVLGIICVIAAFLFPALQSARRSAKITATGQASHQLWLALTLYRHDWGDAATVGTASSMGLPHAGVESFVAAPAKMWMRTCNPVEGFAYWPDDEVGADSWAQAVIAAGDAVPLVSTDTCTNSQWDRDNQFHPKFGIATNLGGSLVTRTKAGNQHKFSWWIK
jgi:prepilin-type N-terminal cleavage/methylation domain-containing protein